jgi:hypothetical protein
MKIKVITSYKPGTWEQYSRKGIESMAQHFPEEIDIVVYAEEPKPECRYDRIQWIDLNTAEPRLFNFKNKHKNDPVANGELQEIPGGVRRPAELQQKGGRDKNKGSYLWAAVRFANKVFCVVNGVRNSKDYDYVVWIDADTFTFRPVPLSFFEKLLPQDTMVTYLGRENPKLNDGGKYPECGFVGYNMRHPEIHNFVDDWENLYVTDDVFKLLEWHDSYVFWHLTKKYRQEKNIQVNDIGYWIGVKGHHVFVNSELGLYMDHMKGKRKKVGSSGRNDLRQNPNAPADILSVDYWKKAPPTG